MSTQLAPVSVVCFYAKADAPLFEHLEQHLRVLRREGIVIIWHKRQIAAGSDRQVELDQHLNSASLILLLISPDFLASDDLYEVELQRAMRLHNDNKACVIPIVLRDCDWEGTPFGTLQVLPRNGKPITLWRNRDKAFAEIVREIRLALGTVQRLTINTPSIPRSKICQIPHQRNPVFTGRDDILQMLTEILQTDHSAVLSQPAAISGLGGIGKTQLAVEYAYRAEPKYQAIFWITAETRETLISGYETIARDLNLLETDDQAPDKKRLIQTVQRWLRTHADWLLILDNADDLPLAQTFVPPTFAGQVLLTTRTQATGRFAHRIEIDILTNEDGALLLLRRAKVLSEQGRLEEAAKQDLTLACQISRELGDLPLALDQAGAYIEETGCSLLNYQQQYQQHWALLLQQRGSFAPDHPEPVTTTWSLSFEKIEQTNPAAAELLRLCAFLHPDAISEKMILAGVSKFGSLLQPFASNSFLFDEAISELRRFSFVHRKDGMLSLHRLVQTVLRERMTDEMQQQWAERVFRVLAITIPKVQDKIGRRRISYQEYNSHLEACASILKQYQISDELRSLLAALPGPMYVGNLSFRTTDDTLEALFKQCGIVKNVKVPYDRMTGLPWGFASVTMSNIAEARIAVKTLNRFILDGREITVNGAWRHTLDYFV